MLQLSMKKMNSVCVVSMVVFIAAVAMPQMAEAFFGKGLKVQVEALETELASEKAESKEKIDTVTEALEAEQSKVSDLERAKSTLEGEVSDLAKKNDELSGKITGLETELAAAVEKSAECDVVKEKCVALEKECAALEEKCALAESACTFTDEPVLEQAATEVVE